MEGLFNEVNALYDEITNPENVRKRKEEKIISEYVAIIENVWDKKRDERLSRYFDCDIVNVNHVISIIKTYDKKKREMVEHFKANVKTKEIAKAKIMKTPKNED